MYRGKKIAAVVPAYNEAPSIGLVVRELVHLSADGARVFDKVVVCSNASTDATAQLAADAGAVVVHEQRPGYGRACLKALQETGDCDQVVFVDGDYSAHTQEVPSLLDALWSGVDLAIGARIASRREPGALEPQQIFGNQFATWLMRLIWRQPVTDLGPLRAIDVRTLQRLEMSEQTFGWTMEMQAKAFALALKVGEVPVSTRRRIGQSKVSGTLRGTIGATWGILSTLAKIAWLTRKAQPIQSVGIK